MGNATLYLADCREALPLVGRVDCVVSDPVWPNCPTGLLIGSDRPLELLSEALAMIEASTVVIVIGFDSDPRFLTSVPPRWQFIRSQQLPYSVPSYAGRLLRGDEVAYVFGAIPKGRGIIPGRARAVATSRASRATGHPCPRADDHMKQLCGWWCPPEGVVLDPFMGTGATGVGAVTGGRRYIGVEIDPTYFEKACERIDQAQKQARLFA